MADAKTVLVTGDMVLDHHIYKGERLRSLDDKSRGVHVVEQLGGAALTQELIQAAFDREKADDPSLPPWQSSLAYACDPRPEVPPELHSYVIWKPFRREGSKEELWRVDPDQSLGYGAPSATPDALPWPAAKTPDPAILVLDDAGAGFRHSREEKHWHLHVAPQWIVLKLAGSVGAGDLWLQLDKPAVKDKLVIVVSVRTLRNMEAQLNPGPSWEQAAEQLARELAFNSSLRKLRACRHLIVDFGYEGAAWVDYTDAGEPKARLIFDPPHVEDEWSATIAGDAFGRHVCLAAAVVRKLARAADSDKDPDIATAIVQGLSAMRRLREQGHGILGAKDSAAGFPLAPIADEIVKPHRILAQAAIPWPPKRERDAASPWSILTLSQGAPAAGRPLFGFARQIALHGDAALKGVPYLRIRKLLTPSREEMESLRILKKTIAAYKGSDPRKAKPLSIGIFGAPGAGKSFAVRELAAGIFGDPGQDGENEDYEGWMEFNLAQFSDTKDLIGAFHQVRDRVLEGLIPVVFWDEFDSREYYWLQYLLAPMQDGKFQEGQITHPIGKCVFIFAGATASSFEHFGTFADTHVEHNFKLAKGPDFKSRLDASLDVLGPNPKTVRATAKASAFQDDPFCPIRRAIFLRAQLGLKPAERLDIDSGLLTALLEIERFEHGSRSLEKLLAPLKAARKQRHPITRSQLASPQHLEMYVDPDRFYELCQRDDPFRQDEIVRTIAPAIHDTWRKVSGASFKYNVDYKDLPSEIKRSNEAAARRMPDILALVGLRLEPGAAKDDQADIRNHLAAHVSLLAEKEHEGWMHHYLAEGWRYDKVRNDGQRLHNRLLPYNELSENDRLKDQDSILHYPDFARTAAWKIAFA